jgi:hypothetical protein
MMTTERLEEVTLERDEAQTDLAKVILCPYRQVKGSAQQGPWKALR